MKTKITIFLLLFISSMAFAQQGINYKALIRDNSGNIVANTAITVQFSILKGTTLSNVYQETHTPTTDSNGLIILNIGNGTVDLGTFDTIDWNSDDHFLNVQIDTGAGLTDLGTTQFMAVPYALNVTGLEKITEGGNTGWRLKGQNPTLVGDIGIKAIDLTSSINLSTVRGATGDYSFATGHSITASGNYATAMGFDTTASGYASTAMGESTTASIQASTAMGLSTTASGIASTAMGESTTASGSRSTAMGLSTTASGSSSTTMGESTIALGGSSTAMGVSTIAMGNSSTAMGVSTIANSYADLAIGRYNLGNGTSLPYWISTDPLFEIGNGTATSPNNALTVYKNGNAKFDGEIQHTSTGSANLVPIAYGGFTNTGGISGGTGNFTVAFNSSTNVYTVSVIGRTLISATTVATATVNTTNFRSVNVTYSGGNMLVHIFVANGTKVASPCQFVIYQQ